MKVILILICLCIYLISFLTSYIYIKISHEKDGIYYGRNTSINEIVMTFIPLINTTFAIISWFFWHPTKKKYNYNKFFKIKE